jgi:hypothetical protein
MHCPHCRYEGPPILSGPYSLHTEVPRGFVWLCANPVCKTILSVSTEKFDDLAQVPKAA